ncbi:alpha/beta fold hydrolase [Pseudomonas sp. NBRC 100443]|uniref:alpha/beta fold hydrolase n=1 Tax=Pseudomonas sp. NBRC 100443 TaxID=1113665 RepID=UPI0024A3FC76|nr:alpha/beta fold hydrolase [Pseudomonas sp. NBRC 100443]GLU41609.1 alpha/beta hydrolase [Pseudomonas sp. NBRC 100443]
MSTAAAWQADLERDFPQRLVRRGEVVSAWREAGAADAPALVLLHGIGSGAASWLPLAQCLKARARLIAWDAPGYGESTPLAEAAPRAEAYMQRLRELLDALDVQRCVLLGHSLGALTALALANAEPRRVARLLLLSPAHGYGARPAEGEAVRSRRLAALASEGIAGLAERRAPAMLGASPSAEALAWVHWNMARLKPHGYRQAVELLCGDDLLRLGRPPVPVEVLCGSEDGITLPAACREVAAALAAPFQLVPGAGHASPIECPEALAGHLVRFLDKD